SFPPPSQPHAPPFPTRRSSDLQVLQRTPTLVHAAAAAVHQLVEVLPILREGGRATGQAQRHLGLHLHHVQLLAHRGVGPAQEHRSEEHTSELQSRENLVCRLLL